MSNLTHEELDAIEGQVRVVLGAQLIEADAVRRLLKAARHSLELEAENARLREALKSILDLIEGDVVDGDSFVVEGIVRRALEARR